MVLCVILTVNLGSLYYVIKEMKLDPLVDWVIAIRIYRVPLFALVTFTNFHTLVAYVQVCIFKCIKEVNDEFCSSVLRRSVIAIHMYFSSILAVSGVFHTDNPSTYIDPMVNLLKPLETR